MPAIVTVRDLKKRYHGVDAVRGISFNVQPGEVLGLLGPNGAGKTTTVECVIGLREPDKGTIDIGGIDARRRPREVKERIGAALQTTALQDKITPREALSLFGSMYRRHEPADALIDRFALADKADEPFDTLSGGQRQRLALALAFVNRPEVVLLDEPTAGLDPQSRRELHAHIGRMKADGVAVLLTTHAIDEAETLCDRVAIIDHGTIVAAGTPRELVAASPGSNTVTLEAAAPLDGEWFAALPGVHDVRAAGTRVQFQTTTPTPTLAALARLLDEKQITPLDLHIRRATLEDVFLQLTGERARD